MLFAINLGLDGICDRGGGGVNSVVLRAHPHHPCRLSPAAGRLPGRWRQVGRKGTMAAAAPATPAAPQVILRGEDDAVSLDVEITHRGREWSHRAAACGEFVPSYLGMGGDCLETTAAKAALFRQIDQEPLETGVQEDRPLAPARAFVGFPRLKSTTVGRGTHRTMPRARADTRKIEGGRQGLGGGRGGFGKCGAHGVEISNCGSSCVPLHEPGKRITGSQKEPRCWPLVSSDDHNI